MPSFDSFWLGQEKAVIRSTSNEWNSGLHQEWLKIVTQSFEIYYTARTNLKQCSDYKLQKAMKEDLESCANEGCSRFISGVQCIKEAFEHLAKNNGRWADPIGTFTDMPFYHQQDWSIYKPYWLKGHRAGVRFMEAFDKKTKEGIDALEKFKSEAKKLEGLKNKAVTEQKKEARSIAEVLKTIKEASEKVEKVLYWTAKAEDIAEVAKVSGKIKEFTEMVHEGAGYVESVQAPVGKALKTGIKAGDEIVKGYELYRRATEAGLSEGEAASIAILERAAQEVPIFGELFAEVLSGVPNTTAMVQAHADELKEAMQRLF